MKKNLPTVISLILIIAAFAVLLVFELVDICYTSDRTVNSLLSAIIPRLIASAALIAVTVLLGCKRVLTPPVKKLPADLIWCVPCFLAVLANFPFSALAVGTAEIVKTNLIALFLLKCLTIGLTEELLFRGLLQSAIAQRLNNTPYKYLLTAVITSAVFALFHLFNLFSGADIGATFLQAGYSFLLGGMLSAVIIKTNNIWLCVVLHTLFDFGGLIVPELGTGNFQDACFWALTTVFGVICLIYILFFLIKKFPPSERDKKERLE